ncbi:helix-hairpin-helix domain-containing protein [Moorena sp. SIO4G3]|uniref:helix-hairpin-helix domain-containing protein n=1 Tax=Moorena sp. SIO4G3 TaxID=2607821 RepID=UPI00344867BE
MNGLGEKIVEQLVDQGLVTSVADLYDLTRKQLVSLKGIGHKLAQKLLNAIAKSKTQPWSRVLYGLGIGHVGSDKAKTLAQTFPNIEKLAQATISDIEGIYGIGPKIAQSVWDWFQISSNQTLIDRLRDAGLQSIDKRPLTRWASCDALDINGLGKKIVEQLVDQGLVTSVADLYDLTLEQLVSLKGIGNKLAQKLLNAIAKSKTQPWSRVLYGLRIRHVGNDKAKNLAQTFPNIEQLAQATIPDIEGIYGIGSEIAQSVWDWFQISSNQTLIDRLREAGLQL